MRHAPALRVLLMASAALLPAAPSGAAPIGRVTAANEAMLGTPPAAARRPLALGLEVVSDERIETTPLGAGQLVFLDRTALTVWPNSDIVLDRYIYDPERGTGQMAIGLSRGLLRFVGGAVSKENDVTITTPHAVVAVRGGIALIEVTATSTRAVHVAGRYTEINGLRLSRTSAAGEATEQGSAQYLGVLDAGAIADVFGRPPGQGTGGLPVRPDPGAVEARAQASGLTAQGSGAPGAPTAPRLSTTGETAQAAQSPAEAADVAGVTVVRQAAAATTREQAGAVSDPTPAVPAVTPPAGTTPVVTPPVVTLPPVSPPPTPTPPTPLPTFAGAQYTILDIVVTSGGPADRNLTVRQFSPTVFNEFEREAVGGVNCGTAVAPCIRARQRRPDGSVGARFIQAERGGFAIEIQNTFNSYPAIQNSFDEPNVFYLSAFRNDVSSAPYNSRSLNFFGEPTPASVWQSVSGADVPVRRYALTDDVFLRLNDPFSPLIGNVFDGTGGSGLYLIGQPFGPVLGTDADSTAAKWLSSVLYIDGEGPNQRSAFGVYTTGAFASTAGAPVAATGGSLIGMARFDSRDTGMRFRVPYGTLDDGAGRTAFGPDGRYLIFGQGGRGDPSEPQRTDEAFITGELLGSPAEQEYGDTRLAILDSSTVQVGAQRATLGVSGAEAGQPGRTGLFLTGGFAATHAASDLNPLHLLATNAAPQVRLRFGPDTGSAAAEFTDLTAVAPAPGTALVGLDLAFGGTGRRSALLNDAVFGMKDDFDGVGDVTGAVNGASGAFLALPSAGEQQAFVGALASSGLAGDGGLPLVNGNQAYLRWGWWAGSVFYNQVQTPHPSERLHLGSWVAGVTARDADLADAFAANRSATYVGFGIAHVVESTPAGRAAYVEPASFALSYNFRDGAGTAAIEGVMGQNFGGPVTAAAAQPGNHYGGTLTGTRDGGGTIDGAFFQGGGDPLAATAGRFAVSGTTTAGNPAQAVGIVAGQQ